MLPKKLTKFLWHFIKKQKALFIIAQILALAWSIDNVAWPYAYKLLIDKITNFNISQGNLWYYLMPVLIFWGGIWLSIDIMFRIQGFVMARVIPRFEAAIRMNMFDYVTGHSYRFFANRFSGNISNRISDMTQSATRIIHITMYLLLPALLALLLACVIFLSVNYIFSLLLLFWSLLHIGTCFLTAKRCASLSKTHADSRSLLAGKVVDAFTNIINIKLFSRRRYEYQNILTYQKDERRKHQKSLTVIEKIKILLNISSIIFPGVILTWYVIYSWQHKIIGIGDVVLIFNTSWNIQMLVWMVGSELPNLFKEIGVCQQALSIIKEDHEITDAKQANNLFVSKGEIIFSNVSFHYFEKNRIFNNVSVKISAGEKVGLVGFSGSGKSTFVNLIMRFFNLESGKIYIDGTDIQTVTTESLRSQIAMIPQNPSLFHRSLWDNIAYGNPDADYEAVIDAAKHANCHDFINKLPDGYNSLAGERGIKLSGGQCQRIAIARAILKNAPILILDEATSALDSVTEKSIQTSLHDLMQNRTTIVVAHRLSTLVQMDRILVFDEGHIIEDGSPENLLAANGHYARMWKMQADGFLPESGKVQGVTAED